MTSLVPYRFTSESLLQTALTHKSFHNENTVDSTGNNERFEFLGDAVIGLVLSDELMRRYPGANEGDLSKWRASLVNEASLAELASLWNLGDALRLGKGEVQSKGTQKPRILASTFEAVIGAIYLDGGFEKAKGLVLTAFTEKLLVEFESSFGDLDFKTRLQERTQELYRTTPRYDVISEMGPDHDKTFTVAVVVGDKQMAIGQGRSKKQAAQAAARQALEKL